MNIFAISIAAIMIALGLSSCSGMADVVAQAKNDNATICAQFSGWGTVATFVRLNPLGNQDAIVKCPSEIQQGNTTPPPAVTVQAGGQMVMNQTVQAK